MGSRKRNYPNYRVFLASTGRELEHFQIQILAGDLYDKFQNDTLEDIIIMFKMARKGDFGKVYKVDVFEVMDWAKQYMDAKAEERERLLRANKGDEKNESQEPKNEGKYFHELPPELQEKFNQMGGKVAKLFLPEKTTELLTREKQMRELANEGKKKKPIKFKKYI